MSLKDMQNKKNITTVTEALQLAKTSLEQIRLTIQGEVTDVADKAGYKACYFTIADDRAALSCLMWKDKYLASGVKLKRGDKIEVTGRFSLYAAKGRMQFHVYSLMLSGEGKLLEKIARIARKLKAEGLMDAKRKLPLPEFPTKVALVTSPHGKVVHDVIKTLTRRNAGVELLFVGVTVEGDNAAQEMIHGLKIAINAKPDAILLCRGGGSIEDMMPFNDERLARTIAESSIPIITGIGHEPDFSIADMVADKSASTPTAAAELVAPSLTDELQKIEGQKERLVSAFNACIIRCMQVYNSFATRPVLASPKTTFLAKFTQEIDLAQDRFYSAIPGSVKKDRDTYEQLQKEFIHAGKSFIKEYKNAISLGAAKLESLSPLKILSRGYAFAYYKSDDGEKKIIDSVQSVHKGTDISLVVSDGEIDAQVQAVKNSINTFDMKGFGNET